MEFKVSGCQVEIMAPVLATGAPDGGRPRGEPRQVQKNVKVSRIVEQIDRGRRQKVARRDAYMVKLFRKTSQVPAEFKGIGHRESVLIALDITQKETFHDDLN